MECLAFDTSEKQYCKQAGRKRPSKYKPCLHDSLLADQPTASPSTAGMHKNGSSSKLSCGTRPLLSDNDVHAAEIVDLNPYWDRMKRTLLAVGMATAVGASLDDGNVLRDMADRPQHPPKNLGGAEKGSMDYNAPLSSPNEAQRNEGVVGVAHDAKDGDATVNGDSVSGEGVFSDANESMDNERGVNVSGTLPGSFH